MTIDFQILFFIIIDQTDCKTEVYEIHAYNMFNEMSEPLLQFTLPDSLDFLESCNFSYASNDTGQLFKN